jgi:hypothetical protein
MKINERALAALAPTPGDIHVTSHASDRAWQRCGITLGTIRREVRDAFAEGRTGSERPAWLPGSSARVRRFAWTAGRDRVYVLQPGRDTWSVTTIMTCDEAAA